MKPRISEEAATQLEEEYVKMRAQGAKAVASNVITATPRQLDDPIGRGAGENASGCGGEGGGCEGGGAADECGYTACG